MKAKGKTKLMHVISFHALFIIVKINLVFIMLPVVLLCTSLNLFSTYIHNVINRCLRNSFKIRGGGIT